MLDDSSSAKRRSTLSFSRGKKGSEQMQELLKKKQLQIEVLPYLDFVNMCLVVRDVVVDVKCSNDLWHFESAGASWALHGTPLIQCRLQELRLITSLRPHVAIAVCIESTARCLI